MSAQTDDLAHEKFKENHSAVLKPCSDSGLGACRQLADIQTCITDPQREFVHVPGGKHTNKKY